MSVISVISVTSVVYARTYMGYVRKRVKVLYLYVLVIEIWNIYFMLGAYVNNLTSCYKVVA